MSSFIGGEFAGDGYSGGGGGGAPSGPAGGDLSGSYPNPAVAGIKGTPVVITTLTTGNGLSYNGTDWVNASLNLAGGSAYVTGSLPTANQVAQSLTLTGDTTSSSGTTAAATTVVVNIHGASVPIAGSLTTGNVLQVSGSSALSYAPINLAGGANYVSGTLPSGNQAAQSLTLTGDATSSGGNTGAATTVVVNIHGASVPIAGSLTTGNVLQVSGSSALSYGAINLGGGSNYVTGTLPAGNQAAQTLTGDVTGTTAANTVVSLTGSAGTVTIPHGTTNISGATAATDVAPGIITITGQLPNASASTNKTPGGIVLATGTPVAGGSVGTVSVVNDGYTQLQLGYANTDFLAMGASPASSGYIRLPAISATQHYITAGTLDAVSSNASSQWVFGNTSTVTNISGATLTIVPGTISLSTNTTIFPVSTNANSFTAALNGGAGFGAANTSRAGGAVSISGGTSAVASSGTAAGAIGGPTNILSGTGAAGLGSNQNGGNGGTITLNTGAGGAATGSGTAGVGGIIQYQIAGTTILNMGGGGYGLGCAAGSIALTTGTTTLTAAQAAFPYIDFGTSTLTGACTVIFPAVATGQTWFVDATDITFAAHAITLQINSNAMSTTISAAALWMVVYTHVGKFFAIPLSTT